MAQISDAFNEISFVEQKKELEQLLTSNPYMEKAVQDIIRTVLNEARKSLSKQAQSGLGISNDPRHAVNAIRSTVYRRILGGNINILAKRRAGKVVPTEARRVPRGHLGGNRRERSQRTQQLEGYYGSDRGFILRFLNAGTEQRHIDFVGGKQVRKPGSHGGKSTYRNRNTGRRGALKSRNWFGGAGQKQMENAAEAISKRIDYLIEQKLKY